MHIGMPLGRGDANDDAYRVAHRSLIGMSMRKGGGGLLIVMPIRMLIGRERHAYRK